MMSSRTTTKGELSRSADSEEATPSFAHDLAAVRVVDLDDLSNLESDLRSHGATVRRLVEGQLPPLSTKVLASGTSHNRLWRPPVDLELIIPALNEEDRLRRTLDETIAFCAGRTWSSAIVVVDNGSVDRTAEIAAERSTGNVPVYAIGCSSRGKGAAVRRGFLTSRAEVVGFMDADLATSLSAIDDAMTHLSSGYDAVVGSRRLADSCIGVSESLVRRTGSRIFHWLAHRVVPSVTDTQCGFKFFRRTALEGVLEACKLDGFAFDVELLALLNQKGVTITEVPVIWDWDESSTFNIRRHGIPTVLDVVLHRFRFGAIAGEAKEEGLSDGQGSTSVPSGSRVLTQKIGR